MDKTMNQEVNNRLNMWIKALPRIAGGTAIVVGSIVLVGWMFDIPLLKSLHPGMVSMKANAALAFILAGTSLLLLHSSAKSRQMKRVAQSLAMFIIVIGLLTSIEYTFGWNTGIDQLLFKDSAGAAGALHEGRMPFSAAVSFVFFGTAILVLEVRTRRGNVPSQILAISVGILGFLGLLGFIYNLPEFVGYAVHTRMAAPGAVTFIVLSIGVLALKPGDGIIGEIRDEGVGGFMARRLLPAAIGIPIVIGWITTEGENLGLYGNRFGDVIAATAYIAIALVAVWSTARSLNKLDAKRRQVEKEQIQSEKHFKELFDDAPVAYHELNLEGRLVRVNQTELRSLGYSVEEMQGHFVWEFLDDQEASRQSVLAKLAGTKPPAKGVERVYRRKDLTTIDVVSEDTLLRDAEGCITGIRTTLQDITELKRAVRLNAALYEISQAVHSSDNPDELYRHIHLALSSIIPANNFFIAVLTNDGKALHFPYERDEKDTGDWKDIEADDSQSLTVEVLRSKRPLLLDEKELLDRYSSSKNRVWGTAPKCWLGVPLMIREKAIGVMAVQDYHRGDVYGQKDVALFESAAGQIAIAIERKRAEEALRDSRESLHRLLNSMAEGAYGVDTNGNCTFVNRAFLQILGYRNEHEFLGRDMHELIHHSHCDGSPYPSSECRMYRAHEADHIVNISNEVFWRKDGVAIPVEYWSQPIVKNDVVVGSMATFIDITERKQAEQRRESLIKELKTALENVRTLDGLVPICAHCKKIRDDKGYWNQLEKYIVDHTDAKLTHGLCPDCAELYFPGIAVKGSGERGNG